MKRGRRPATSSVAALLLAGACTAGGCVTPGAHTAAAPAIDAQMSADGTSMVQVRNAWLRVHTAAPAAAEAGTPVVFVHGFGSRLEAWRQVQPAVAAVGHPTVSFDQRGFGLSERAEGAYGPESHAADLLALLDEQHIDRAVLVGHSYGCGVVLRLALRHPERVAAIVLVSPFALDEQVGTYFQWARVPGLGEAMFTSSFRDYPGEKYLMAFGPENRAKFVSVAALDEVQRLQAREGSTYAALATIRGMDYASVESDYAKIAAPITVVWGEKDRVTNIRMLDTFAARLPKAKFVRIPGVGHMPPWERPDIVTAAILGARPAEPAPLQRIDDDARPAEPAPLQKLAPAPLQGLQGEAAGGAR